MRTPNATGQLILALDDHQSGTSKNGSGFSDPAFASNKYLPLHRWVPWIAGFSSGFVRDAIQRYMNGGGIVLDPFCGVGTTLVEAMLLGYDSVGFEINPFPALASRVKANARAVNPHALAGEISKFAAFYSARASNGYQPSSRPPPGFRTRSEFYSPAVMRKVLLMLDFFTSIEEPSLREVFRLAFASTMVSYSNYSYEPSLGRRASAGKHDIADYPVGEMVLEKLRDIQTDITWLGGQATKDTLATVVNDSFFKAAEHLSESTVDLVVTSPPYLNNYHYNRNTRPQLYWLGFAATPKDFCTLEESNFGKYWQTVRGQENVPLLFTLSGSGMLEKLDQIRNINPEKGTYGGRGWANYAASYFNDCLRFAETLRFLLKPGGTALVVLGNSILQGVFIPTDVYFAEIARHAGLRVVDIHQPRAVRTGNSIIQSQVRVGRPEASTRLYESIVELRNN